MFKHHVSVGALLCACLFFNHNHAAAQADPNYYNSVDESSPSALRNSLHAIIDDHTRFPYTSSATDTWDVLELAGEDVDNTNQVITIYKNSANNKVGGGNNNYNREHSWPSHMAFPMMAATTTLTLICTICSSRQFLQLITQQQTIRHL